MEEDDAANVSKSQMDQAGVPNYGGFGRIVDGGWFHIVFGLGQAALGIAALIVFGAVSNNLTIHGYGQPVSAGVGIAAGLAVFWGIALALLPLLKLVERYETIIFDKGGVFFIKQEGKRYSWSAIPWAKIAQVELRGNAVSILHSGKRPASKTSIKYGSDKKHREEIKAIAERLILAQHQGNVPSQVRIQT